MPSCVHPARPPAPAPTYLSACLPTYLPARRQQHSAALGRPAPFPHTHHCLMTPPTTPLAPHPHPTPHPPTPHTPPAGAMFATVGLPAAKPEPSSGQFITETMEFVRSIPVGVVVPQLCTICIIVLQRCGTGDACATPACPPARRCTTAGGGLAVPMRHHPCPRPLVHHRVPSPRPPVHHRVPSMSICLVLGGGAPTAGHACGVDCAAAAAAHSRPCAAAAAAPAACWALPTR